MSTWQASGATRAIKLAEAQLRRAHSFWGLFRMARERVTHLSLRERARRYHIQRELRQPEGPNAIIIRLLEREADWAHDRRLLEQENMAMLVRKARDAELQAEMIYQEAEER